MGETTISHVSNRQITIVERIVEILYNFFFNCWDFNDGAFIQFLLSYGTIKWMLAFEYCPNELDTYSDEVHCLW